MSLYAETIHTHCGLCVICTILWGTFCSRVNVYFSVQFYYFIKLVAYVFSHVLNSAVFIILYPEESF